MMILALIFSFNVQSMDIKGLETALRYPDCSILKDYLYLSKEQQAELEKSLQDYSVQRVVRRYKVICPAENWAGYIFSDKVRTHFQHIFVLLNGSKVKNVEVIKFDEPLKYKAPARWLDFMFKDKGLNALKVDSISGATLTTQSILRVVKMAEAVNRL